MELIITTKEQLSELIEDSIRKALSGSEQKREVLKKDKLLTMSELREYLPEKPARQTVYGWVTNNKIPYEKHGSKLFFKKSKIDAWLDNGRRVYYSI